MVTSLTDLLDGSSIVIESIVPGQSGVRQGDLRMSLLLFNSSVALYRFQQTK